MNDLFQENLTLEEINILLEECNEQIGQLKAKLTLLVIERDSLRTELVKWKNEKDILELLRTGADFKSDLVPLNDTLRDLKEKYSKLAKRYNTIFNEIIPKNNSHPHLKDTFEGDF